mgnify:CR=1
MTLIQLHLILRLIISPMLILTALLIIISSIRIGKKYRINKTLCFTIFMIGLSLLVIGVSDLITNPARTLLITP